MGCQDASWAGEEPHGGDGEPTCKEPVYSWLLKLHGMRRGDTQDRAQGAHSTPAKSSQPQQHEAAGCTDSPHPSLMLTSCPPTRTIKYCRK